MACCFMFGKKAKQAVEGDEGYLLLLILALLLTLYLQTVSDSYTCSLSYSRSTQRQSIFLQRVEKGYTRFQWRK